MSIRVLTLWPEWAWAICALDKRVENRTWVRGAVVGEMIAIHAGRCVGGNPSQRAYRRGVQQLRVQAERAGWRCEEIASPQALPMGDRPLPLLRFLRGSCNVPFAPARCAILALARIRAIIPPAPDADPQPWGEVGAYHWMLEAVRPLSHAIPCPGQQGLWKPDGLTARLLELEVRRCQP